MFLCAGNELASGARFEAEAIGRELVEAVLAFEGFLGGLFRDAMTLLAPRPEGHR